MTTIRHTSNDNNLDALLEDLQSSVSRPGSATGVSNGQLYHEVSTSVREESSLPSGQRYRVQYLSAANPTTVLSERTHSPGGEQHTTYKTVSYQYNTAGHTVAVPSETERVQDGSVSDARLRQNLTELDSLLVDLHQAQKAGFSTEQSGVVSVRGDGVDASLLEPMNVSGGDQRVTRTVRSYQKRDYYSGSGNESPRLQPRRSTSAQRELVYGNTDSSTHSRTRSPSPVPRRSAMHKEYHYETKNTKTNVPASPPRTHTRDKSPLNHHLQKEYYHEMNKSTTVPIPPSPRQDRSTRDVSPPTQRHYGGPAPSDGQNNRMTTVRTYNYTYPESPATPPHRSTSPSLSNYPHQPGTKVTTTVRTYTYELPGSGSKPIDGGDQGPGDRTLTYHVSPQREKEPLMPPPEPTVITYKYSTQSSHSNSSKFPTSPPEEQQPFLPRPFPTASPTPASDSQPPKRLDDLMASFSDTELHQHHHHHHNAHPELVPANTTVRREYILDKSSTAAPSTESNSVVLAASNQNAKDRPKTKNVPGPPVYYPPGVELFSKKEESMQQAGSWRDKGQYEYEASRESKSKSSSGGAAVVPVCLPLCCAMPCVIM